MAPFTFLIDLSLWMKVCCGIQTRVWDPDHLAWSPLFAGQQLLGLQMQIDFFPFLSFSLKWR